MITAYMLVAMWASFIFGGAAHSLVAKPEKQEIDTVYKIGVDLQGNTVSTCKEEK